MRRKAVVPAAAIFVAMASFLVSATPRAVEASQGLHKVTICHFAGHKGDFVTNNWITLGVPQCVANGGEGLVVAPQGCENGHGAIARFGRDCYQGANQAGAP